MQPRVSSRAPAGMARRLTGDIVEGPMWCRLARPEGEGEGGAGRASRVEWSVEGSRGSLRGHSVWLFSEQRHTLCTRAHWL